MAGSKLKIDIRRSKIMDQLRREGNVSVPGPPALGILSSPCVNVSPTPRRQGLSRI